MLDVRNLFARCCGPIGLLSAVAVAVTVIATIETLTWRGGLERTSGRGDAIGASFPHWRWAVIDGDTYHYRDFNARSRWIRLSGVHYSSRGDGEETWRLVHQGQVRLEVGGRVVVDEPEAAPICRRLDEGTRTAAFQVQPVDGMTAFTLTATGVRQRIDRSGKVDIRLERRGPTGAWSALAPARLHGEVPDAAWARTRVWLAGLGEAARWVLALAALVMAARGARRLASRAPHLAALIAVAVVGSFLVRHQVFVERAATDPTLWGLSAKPDNYLLYARTGISGGGYPWGSIFSPGNTWWMILLSLLVGTEIDVVSLANVVVASLGVGALCAATWRVFGRAAAWIAGLAAMLYPPLVFHQTTLQISSMGTSMLMFVALAVVLLMERPGARRGLACGVLMGLAALFRPTALPMAVLTAAALALGAWRGRADPRRARVSAAAAALLIVGAALPVAAQAAFNRANGRDVLIADNTVLNLVIGNSRDASGDYGMPDAVMEGRALVAKSEATLVDWFVREIGRDPRRFAELQLHKLGRFVGADERSGVIHYVEDGLEHSPTLRALARPAASWMPALCALAVVGMLALAGRGRGRRSLHPAARLLALLLCAHVCGTTLAFVNGRIRAPSLALIIPFAALGVRELVAARLTGRTRVLLHAATGAVLVAGALWCERHLPRKSLLGSLPPDAHVVDEAVSGPLRLEGHRVASAVPMHSGFVYVELFWSIDAVAEVDHGATVRLIDPTTGEALAERVLEPGTIGYPPRGTRDWPVGAVLPEALYVKVTRVMPDAAVLQVEGEDGAPPLSVGRVTLVRRAPSSAP